MRRLHQVVLFVLLISQGLQAQEVKGEALSPHYFEVMVGYVVNSKFDSAAGGVAMIQNATDSFNLAVRYKRNIFGSFDLGLGVSLDSNRTFIGRSVNGTAIAYLNPVPNLTLMGVDFSAFFNYQDFYAVGTVSSVSFHDANFPSSFKPSLATAAGLGWRASDTFVFELDYRLLNLNSDYYSNFSQNGFLIRVGYSFR